MASILIFSPHPDDAEICLGGLIITYSKKYSIKIIQMTNGEASTNGNMAIRIQEENESIQKLKNVEIEYLNFTDLNINSNNYNQLTQVVEIIKKEKPSMIFLPSHSDLHTDHREANILIRNSINIAGIGNKSLDNISASHTCKILFEYSTELQLQANSIYVDVSEVYEDKKRLLDSFSSQLNPLNGIKTFLNIYLLQKIMAKDSYCGALIQTKYAEEIIPLMPIKLNNLFNLV